MSEEFDPDVVVKYALDTWSRCAENYVDTFAGITRETVPLLMEIAGIRPGGQVLEIGSGPAMVTGVGCSRGLSAIDSRGDLESRFA